MNKKLGLVLGVLFFSIFLYIGIRAQFTREARWASSSDCPELVWLKREFALSEMQFQRVKEIHNSHELHCSLLCRDLAKTEQRLMEAGNSSSKSSEDLQEALAEWREVRKRSQDLIIDHMFQVSSVMDKEPGRGYLEHVFNHLIVPVHPLQRENKYGIFDAQLSPRLNTLAAD